MSADVVRAELSEQARTTVRGVASRLKGLSSGTERELLRQGYVAEERSLVDLLAKDAEISRHVSRAELEKMCDPANYLGSAPRMVDAIVRMQRPS